MRIFYSINFEKKFKVFNKKGKAKEQIEIFLKDPFDKRLNTHKLKGKFKNYYAFSVDYEDRIIFSFVKSEKTIYFHTIGSHDIYK